MDELTKALLKINRLKGDCIDYQEEVAELKGFLKCVLNYYEDGHLECQGMIGATELMIKIKRLFP